MRFVKKHNRELEIETNLVVLGDELAEQELVLDTSNRKEDLSFQMSKQSEAENQCKYLLLSVNLSLGNAQNGESDSGGGEHGVRD